MNSLDGERKYLKGLKYNATQIKFHFGENSKEHIAIKKEIKEQKEKIIRWQNKVNSGEEKVYLPDYSGTLQSQIQAKVKYERKAIEKMPYWYEKNNSPDGSDAKSI